MTEVFKYLNGLSPDFISEVFMLTHFLPIFPFYTPLKTPENIRISGVFRWYKMGTLAKNGLKSSYHNFNNLANPKLTLQKVNCH